MILTIIFFNNNYYFNYDCERVPKIYNRDIENLIVYYCDNTFFPNFNFQKNMSLNVCHTSKIRD